MHSKVFALTLLSAIALGACGEKSSSETSITPDTAANTPVASETAPPPESKALDPVKVAATEEMSEEALLKKGKIVFLRCRSCHTLEKEGAHLTGPNLNGLFGAVAGEKEGYVFSDALKVSTIVWNEDSLDAWVKQPRTYIPDNKMAFPGLPAEKDRVALMAYLKANTQ